MADPIAAATRELTVAQAKSAELVDIGVGATMLLVATEETVGIAVVSVLLGG